MVNCIFLLYLVLWLSGCADNPTPSNSTHESEENRGVEKTSDTLKVAQSFDFSLDESFGNEVLCRSVASPDGNKVALVTESVNFEKKSLATSLYYRDLESKEFSAIFKSQFSSYNHLWSGDAKSIYYLSKNDGKSSLYRVDVGSGQISKVWAEGREILAFGLSNDREKMWFTTPCNNVHNGQIEAFSTLSALQKSMKSQTPLFCATISDDTLRYVEPVVLEGDSLYLRGEQGDIAFNHEGTQIAFSGQIYGQEGGEGDGNSIFIYDLETKSIKRVSDVVGNCYSPKFANDDLKIAWLTAKTHTNRVASTSVYYSFLTSGKSYELDSEFLENVNHFEWQASSGIFFASDHWRGRGLYSVSIESRERAHLLVKGDWDCDIVNVSDSLLLFAKSSITSDPELYGFNLMDETESKLTNFVDKKDSLSNGVEVKYSQTRSSDGFMVESTVVYPPNFDKSKLYPLIFLLSDIEPSADLAQRQFNTSFFASNGFIVVKPHLRSFLGWSKKSGALKEIRNLSHLLKVQAIQDINHVVDGLRRQKWVDNSKFSLLATPSSQFISFTLLSNSYRFKRAVVVDGVFDLEALKLYNKLPSLVESHLPSPFWIAADEIEQLYSLSPKKNINKWRVPTLVVASKNDKVVPYEQSVAAFNLLQKKGIESELLLLDEGLEGENSTLLLSEWYEYLLKWLKN